MIHKWDKKAANVFLVWLALLNMIIYSYIHSFSYKQHVFILCDWKKSIAYKYFIFIDSCVDRHLDWLYIVGIVNIAVISKDIQVSFYYDDFCFLGIYPGLGNFVMQ